MADIFDWSATASNNTTLDGINVNTGMNPGNVDNAIRSLMALVRNSFVPGWEGLLVGTTSGIPVSNGAGTISTKAAPTGDIVGTTDAQTLTNKTLGSGTAFSSDIAVADGGTGASTAADARTNLGAVGISAVSLTATGGYVRFTHSLLPSGFTVQWGSFTPVGDSYQTITYPVAFASFSRAVVSCAAEPGNNDGQQNGPETYSCSTANFTTWTSANTFSTAFWIAVGV